MEDKILKDLQEWQEGTQKVFDNLTNFVNSVKKDLTPEEVELVEKEMNNFDTTQIKVEIDKISKKLNDHMANFKM